MNFLSKRLRSLRESFNKIASEEDISSIYLLESVFASEDFKVLSSKKIDIGILKLAKDISKFAATYYGKGGAGLLLVCKEDGTALLLKRSRSVEQPFTWGIPGGALSRGEGWHGSEDSEIGENISDDEFQETAFREAEEELFSRSSTSLNWDEMTFIGQTDFVDGSFTYRTFVYDIPLSEKKRISSNLSLNWENDKAKWYSLSDLPSNLHFGVEFTKKKIEEQGIELFPHRKDNLDWIRDFLNNISKKVKPESIKTVKELSDKIPDMIPTKVDGEDGFDFRIKLAIAVNDFFNHISKELNRIGERKAAIETINFASNFAKKPGKDENYYSLKEKDLRKLPLREQASHAGFFYHGSELRNALSILKSNKFVGAGAFTRLSLSTDPYVASKFGDTVFVFDAKKLQRRGAKKMNYGDVSLIEKIRKDTGKDIDENYLKNPWITDLYRYEKEWVMQLPYEIRPGEIVKIIYFGDTSNKNESGFGDNRSSAKEAFNILNEATDIPIEIINYPSFGSHYPSRSSKVETSTVNLTELVYSSVFTEQSSIERLNEKYTKSSEALVVDKTYLSNKKYLYQSDILKKIIGSVQSLVINFGLSARGLTFEYISDSDTVIKFYKEIETIRKYLDSNISDNIYNIIWLYGFDTRDDALQFLSPYIFSLKNILDNILSNKDKFLETMFSKHFGEIPKDINYIVTYFAGDYSLQENIYSEAKRWCSQNLDKILAIPDLKKYLEEHCQDVFQRDYYRYRKNIDESSINSRISDLLRYAEPNSVPDEMYVDNFLSLIDNKNLENIPDSRLQSIAKRYLSEGKPNYDGGKYDANWIFRYRAYGSIARKHKLEVLMLAIGGKSFEDFEERDYSNY